MAHNLKEAIGIMIGFAEMHGWQGAGEINIISKDDYFELYLKGTGLPKITCERFILGKAFREPDPNKGSKDTGANYSSIAASKNAQMMRTGMMASFADTVANGETGYPGGAIGIKDNDICFVSFSGVKPVEDLSIAIEGIKALGFEVVIILEKSLFAA